MILITGSTGRVGQHLVRILSERGQAVRALVRTSEKAKTVDLPNVEIAYGDFSDKQSMTKALNHIDKLFLLSKERENQALLQEQCIRAAQQSGVTYIVKLSCAMVTSPTKSKIGSLHHMTENLLKISGIPHTNLRPNFFMQNLGIHHSEVNNQDKMRAPMKDGRVSMIHVKDVARIAAEVLLNPQYQGKSYDLSGVEAFTYDEIAQRLSTQLGRTIRYENIPPSALGQALANLGLPTWQIEAIQEDFMPFANGFGEPVTQTVHDFTGETPLTIDDYLKEWVS